MVKDGIVYCYENLVNGKKYVGCTTTDTCKARWDDHDKAKSGCPYFNNAVKKYGRENFVRYILEDEIPTDDNRETLLQLEMYWVGELGTFGKGGYNMTTGGEKGKRFFHSEDTKRRIAENSPKIWKGKKLGPETRKLISEARKRQAPFTPEQEAKRQESLKRAYAEGRRKPVYSRKVLRLDTGEVFVNTQAFADSIGVSRGSVTGGAHKINTNDCFFVRDVPVYSPIEDYRDLSDEERISFLEELLATGKHTQPMYAKRLRQPVYCIDTDTFYESMGKAVGPKHTGDLREAIEKGRRYNGYLWEFAKTDQYRFAKTK